MQPDLDRRAVLSHGAAFALIAGIGARIAPLYAQASDSGSGSGSGSGPQPFRIQIADATLAEIRRRVSAVKWPTTSKGAHWKYGVDPDWFHDIVTYWRDRYDWRAQEAALNKTPQFMANVAGRNLHFAHLRPAANAGQRRPPLLLLHGWPYTFATMLPLAERMSRHGFEVIVPSLPGFAFSPAADDQVRGLRFIAKRIDALLTQVLGHDRYLVHGGDFGAVVADWLALDTKHVLGIHANMISFRHHGAEFGSGNVAVADATPEENAFVAAEKANVQKESAYFQLQLTRPETVVYALADSPVGWAAYMLDKWQKWTDPQEGAFDTVYGRDRLLTEVMLFLVTDSIATSIWPYAGFATEPFSLEPGQKIAVPFGYSEFPDPLLVTPTPRHFVARSRTDIRMWRVHERGGHFPMLEQTDVLANDLREFADTVNSSA